MALDGTGTRARWAVRLAAQATTTASEGVLPGTSWAEVLRAVSTLPVLL